MYRYTVLSADQRWSEIQIYHIAMPQGHSPFNTSTSGHRVFVYLYLILIRIIFNNR